MIVHITRALSLGQPLIFKQQLSQLIVSEMLLGTVISKGSKNYLFDVGDISNKLHSEHFLRVNQLSKDQGRIICIEICIGHLQTME